MAELTAKQETAYKAFITAATSPTMNDLLDEFSKLLPTSQNKRAEIADIFIEMLESSMELPAKKRSRLMMLLATIDTPNAAQIVAKYASADPGHSNDRVQIWALISLVKMSAHQDTYKLLESIAEQGSSNNRIHALILRLLVQCAGDDLEVSQGHIDNLKTFYQEGDADHKWAVLRALRNRTELEPLSPDIERRFIKELIAPALQNDFEWLDVQLQAVQVFGEVQHHLAEAMRHLSDAFQSSSDDTLRRYCIESMSDVAQRMDKTELDSSQFAKHMITALEDESADVRSRAQATLKKVYKSQGAVDLIANFLVQQEELSGHYVEALRHIDEVRASDALRNKLFHLDPDVAKRASDALIQLGGEQAFRTLFAQKRQVIEQYTEILNDADEKIMAQFNLLMRQARWAFWISMGMHSLVFLVGISIFAIALGGMLVDGTEDSLIYVRGFLGIAGGTAGVILGIFYKSPVRNIGESVTRLVKVNVAFLGYMRQINQIDATFKQLFLDMSGFNLVEMKETVKQIHIVVNQSLSNIQNYLVIDDVPVGEESGGRAKRIV
jgi:HEAT repeat protein